MPISVPYTTTDRHG